MKILLIEDEKITRISLTNTLAAEGYDIDASATGLDGLEKLKMEKYDVVITDLRLPKTNGLEILKFIKTHSPKTDVIIITAYASVDTAIEALKLGAYDYLLKPFSPDKLLAMLTHIKHIQHVELENKTLKKQLKHLEQREIIGYSSKMKTLKETIQTVSDNDYTILIDGESGTGKEMIARALHQNSHRKTGAFIALNCAAIPETLLESELFGHEKGAFTGADKKHTGLFERANGGSLFIDDIDDFPLPLQVKLLRVLQERELMRVGGSDLISINVRVISASKINLKKMVSAGTFREDLYYRLNIIPISIPPLRERLDDIPHLLKHLFIKHHAPDKLSALNPRILHHFMNYQWPGNVRELENIVERIIALSNMNNWESLIIESLQNNNDFKKSETKHVNTGFDNFESYEDYIFHKEKSLFDWALNQSDNNITKAARILKLPRSTFRSKIDKNKFYN